MVASGRATIHNQNSRVKSVMLRETASSHARMIGPPGDGRATGVRFSVREKLDGGGVAWKHHPRSTYE